MSKKKPAAIAPWTVTKNMFLSEPEVDALLKFVRDRIDATERSQRAIVDCLIIELLLFSGLRNSELCHLRVVDALTGHGQSAIRVAGTPTQDRMVYVPSILSSRIQRFVCETRPALIRSENENEEGIQSLILNERGRPYDRTALYRRVVRILSEAGLEDRASVQLLRHTYGYLAFKRTGGNLLFVQKQMGHAHPMVTAVYADFVQFSYAELANSVGTDESRSIHLNSHAHVSQIINQ